MLDNARILFYYALKKCEQLKNDIREIQDEEINSDQSKEMNSDFLLFQRVQLLSVMSQAIAENRPMGEFRQQALADNIDFISEEVAQASTLSSARRPARQPSARP